jgi:acetyl-CoA carboxylase biotin carboxylase subunit
LGVSTVAVHSDVDHDSMHVRLADESVCIGSHQPQNSYLNIAALMSAIDLTNAEAVHPGYGFLSENYDFAKIVAKHGVKFIGPSPELIKCMGNKVEAKQIASKNGLPVIQGSEGTITSLEQAKKISSSIKYPVLIKASGGGGGKGMKLVTNESQLENALNLAKNEAKKYFNNDKVYIEKYFSNPRHIEVQILSDKNKTIHLGERDCSIQRKHQKLIEETPSPVLKVLFLQCHLKLD